MVDDGGIVCAAGGLDNVARLDVADHIRGDDVEDGALLRSSETVSATMMCQRAPGTVRKREDPANVERDVIRVEVARLDVGAALAATRRRRERAAEMRCSVVTTGICQMPYRLFCA